MWLKVKRLHFHMFFLNSYIAFICNVITISPEYLNHNQQEHSRIDDIYVVADGCEISCNVL